MDSLEIVMWDPLRSISSVAVVLVVSTSTSVIRPASFCGVMGFKPTFGRISRYRVLLQAPLLDTIGVFARTLEDVSLIADVLVEYDSRDRQMEPRARPAISRIMAEPPPADPHLALVRSPVWSQAEETTKDAIRELISVIEDRVDIVQLPAAFGDAHEAHRRILEADLAKNFAGEYRDGKEKLSTALCDMIERGQKVSAVDYNEAIEQAGQLNEELTELFLEYDAILTPSAPGEAPVGLESTGSPAFCTIWTLCGTPALNLPLLQGPHDMPLGVQLVGEKGDDGRLLRTANWLIKTLNEKKLNG